jgi:hypothetical protein
MDKLTPESITIDEALALMVNMDYIPDGLTVLDMTSAFLEEAEVEYENAVIDRLPKEQLSIYKTRLEICTLRHELAETVLDALKLEVKSIDCSMLKLADLKSPVTRLTLDSVSEWAYDRYGFGISNDIQIVRINDSPPSNQPKVKWTDITIKIYKDYKIGWQVEGGKFQHSSFHDIGLIDKRKNSPNKEGVVLIGLSQKMKFPSGSTLGSADKTSCSRLRNALKKLTTISDDPFYKFNSDVGFKPLFTLSDDRHNSAQRAKKEATHEQYDEEIHAYATKDFEDEDDETGDYLKNL